MYSVVAWSERGLVQWLELLPSKQNAWVRFLQPLCNNTPVYVPLVGRTYRVPTYSPSSAP
jgi:hypothetical protein